MKTIANRLIVFAASAFALGTVAFGQTRMTAEIPFAFHTVTGTLPAGTYSFDRLKSAGMAHTVIVTNTKTSKATVAGTANFDAWKKAPDAPVAVFACVEGRCTLKALRTSEGTAEYAAPHRTKNAEVAEISVPLKAHSAD